MMELTGKRVVVLAADDYEDLELWYPYYRMKEAGAEVRIVGTASSAKRVHSKHGYPAEIDLKADEADPDQFDAVIVPGGWAPDRLRRCRHTLDFVRKLYESGKVVAAICHGGWVLVSADVLKGKRATSVSAIKDDMRNAGADWVDEEVVVDGNLITSRFPDDLPAFCREIIRALGERGAEATSGKYRCTVCGYIYDPEKGDPDSDIGPGTPFEDLPDDWVCPECGAPKEMFEPLEE